MEALTPLTPEEQAQIQQSLETFLRGQQIDENIVPNLAEVILGSGFVAGFDDQRIGTLARLWQESLEGPKKELAQRALEIKEASKRTADQVAEVLEIPESTGLRLFEAGVAKCEKDLELIKQFKVKVIGNYTCDDIDRFEKAVENARQKLTILKFIEGDWEERDDESKVETVLENLNRYREEVMKFITNLLTNDYISRDPKKIKEYEGILSELGAEVYFMDQEKLKDPSYIQEKGEVVLRHVYEYYKGPDYSTENRGKAQPSEFVHDGKVYLLVRLGYKRGQGEVKMQYSVYDKKEFDRQKDLIGSTDSIRDFYSMQQWADLGKEVEKFTKPWGRAILFAFKYQKAISACKGKSFFEVFDGELGAYNGLFSCYKSGRYTADHLCSCIQEALKVFNQVFLDKLKFDETDVEPEVLQRMKGDMDLVINFEPTNVPEWAKNETILEYIIKQFEEWKRKKS